MSAPAIRVNPFKRTIHKSDYERSATYAVHGFWPGDSVRVFQATNISDGNWRLPSINWSTGGRSNDAEPDDTIAAECFSLAIRDAAKIARKWAKEVAK